MSVSAVLIKPGRVIRSCFDQTRACAALYLAVPVWRAELHDERIATVLRATACGSMRSRFHILLFLFIISNFHSRHFSIYLSSENFGSRFW